MKSFRQMLVVPPSGAGAGCDQSSRASHRPISGPRVTGSPRHEAAATQSKVAAASH